MQLFAIVRWLHGGQILVFKLLSDPLTTHCPIIRRYRSLSRTSGADRWEHGNTSSLMLNHPTTIRSWPAGRERNHQELDKASGWCTEYTVLTPIVVSSAFFWSELGAYCATNRGIFGFHELQELVLGCAWDLIWISYFRFFKLL